MWPGMLVGHQDGETLGIEEGRENGDDGLFTFLLNKNCCLYMACEDLLMNYKIGNI